MARRKKTGGTFTLAGKTQDGKQIVQGAFAMVDTYGIPLDIVLSTLEDRGMLPDWLDFYESALAAGWNPKNVITKLEMAIGDVYGPLFLEGWKTMMADYMVHRSLYRKDG